MWWSLKISRCRLCWGPFGLLHTMMETMWSRFWSEYGCLSIASPQGKAHEDSLHLEIASGLHDRAEYFCPMQPALSLLSQMLMFLLAVFGFTLSVIDEGTDAIIPRKLIFFFLKHFPVKFFGNWCFSGFSYKNISCYPRPGELFWFSAGSIGGNKS